MNLPFQFSEEREREREKEREIIYIYNVILYYHIMMCINIYNIYI